MKEGGREESTESEELRESGGECGVERGSREWRGESEELEDWIMQS